MNKRHAVEWLYYEGRSPSYVYERLRSKYPDITIEWIKEVFDEMEDDAYYEDD